MRKILITEPFQQKHVACIQNAATDDFIIEQMEQGYTEEALRTRLLEAEIVIGQPPMWMLMNPEVDCPKLRLIQMTWAGTDQYTRSELPFPKETVKLANASGAYGMVMSQFVMGMILSVMLNFKLYHKQQQEKIWERKGPIQSLVGKKVMIYGAGDIGSAIAKRLSGFDTETIGVCRKLDQSRPYFHKLVTLKDAEQYLSEMDVVIGCIPNSDETMGYFQKERLQKMKQGAILVNVGRGNFVDCMALDMDLRSGHLWGAALDVTSPEPLPVDHPLWENPRCMITPHASGTAFAHLAETEDLLCEIACDNVGRYCRGKEIRNQIVW